MGPVICLVTDRRRYGDGSEDDVVARARAAAEAGVHLIQIRERDLEAGVLGRLVSRCVEAVRGTRTRVLVNDRIDIALAAGAHGVHLPADGVPAERVRAKTPAGFIIGRSVHGPEEAVSVARAGAVDYLIFGTVFPTASKPGVMAVGVKPLQRAASVVSVPILAIGGVTFTRMRELAQSGASGFAAIGLFAGADSSVMLRNVVRQASIAFDTLQPDSRLLASDSRGKPEVGSLKPDDG